MPPLDLNRDQYLSYEKWSFITTGLYSEYGPVDGMLASRSGLGVVVAACVAGVAGWLALDATGISKYGGFLSRAQHLSTPALVRQAVFRERVDLLPHQTDYLFSITESEADFSAFYQAYCDPERAHPLLDSDKLVVVCAKGQHLANAFDAK